MSVPVIAFFNNKGGVGKTSLVYHLAWMLEEEFGRTVLVADLDPQANLSAMFCQEEELEQLWEGRRSVYSAISPLLKGIGDVTEPHLERRGDELFLLVGDMALGDFEDELSQQWPKCLDKGFGTERAFRVLSAFWRLVQRGAAQREADLVLLDLGPNLGSINRAALIASDHVVVPLDASLFSLQGLRNAGPKLSEWRRGWQERKSSWARAQDQLEPRHRSELDLPPGGIKPAGYVVMQHGERLNRPVKTFRRWVERIPGTYSQAFQLSGPEPGSIEEDPGCLGLVRHYRSLMPLAQDARKPMFRLRSGDGAIGAHQQNVQTAFQNFRELAGSILQACGLEPGDRPATTRGDRAAG